MPKLPLSLLVFLLLVALATVGGFAVAGDETSGQKHSDQEALDAEFLDGIEWGLKKDRKGVQVYTAKIAGSSHRAVLSTVEIRTSMSALVALVLDLPNCSRWAKLCKEARTEQRISPTESIVYSINDVPFPVRDRDAYAHVKWAFDADTGVVTMRSRAIADQYPINKRAVRIRYAHSSWRFVPSSKGSVIVENFAHVDPNGVIPAWLTNMLIVDAPYNMLRRMRKVLEAGEYEDATVAFLSPQAKLFFDQATPLDDTKLTENMY